MAFVNERTEDGQWQTIDRERDAVLNKVSGPDQEGNYHCRFTYKGEIVKFDATSGMKIHGEPKLGKEHQYEMNWKIFRLFVPEEIQNHKAEITDLITEVLKAYGDNFNTTNAHSVSIQFSPNAI